MARFSVIVSLFLIAQLGLVRAVIHAKTAAPPLSANFQKAIIQEASRWTEAKDLNYEQLKEESLSGLISETATSRYGLNSEEIFAIHAYTEFMSTSVNRSLNSGDTDTAAFFRPYIDTLKIALSKIPDYQDETVRIVEFPKDVLARHQVGKIVSYHGFTNSSIGAAYGLWSRNTRLVIKGKHGKRIDEFSSEPEEREVIFSPETKFRVLSRSVVMSPAKKPVTVIKLEEI